MTPLAAYKTTALKCAEDLDVFAQSIRISGLRTNRWLMGFLLPGAARETKTAYTILDENALSIAPVRQEVSCSSCVQIFPSW